METTSQTILLLEKNEENIQVKFFSNETGEELTLPEIIDQNKKITRVTVSCLDGKREVPADGFFKSRLGFKKEVTYKIFQEFFGEIKMKIIEESVMVGIPLNDENFAIHSNLSVCATKGIRKEYECDSKQHFRLKFFFSPERILEIDWE